ncbi:MAG: C40 family peptidase [Thiothrix sp.]|uniref:C40 family peptidase n=1 Tax=Thiothrix sp. TaxID=1032 RepID=UPI002623772E|nr:C40 family peptidase [Thiothrix sp.]MDD5394895.1 C40 family peptidase [Thiothrix sp.]
MMYKTTPPTTQGGKLVFALLVTIAGCSTGVSQPPGKTASPHKAAHIRSTSAKPYPTLIDRIVWNAQKQKGKMYKWGGTNPTAGFDCSGLTQYAFRQGAGVQIPRTAADQYGAAVKIPAAQAKKGDVVFFRTHGQQVSHVGLYIGQGKFVHAPRTGKAITTSSLSGYWEKHLVGFGRIPGVCRPVLS